MSCSLTAHLAVAAIRSHFRDISRLASKLKTEDPTAIHDVRVASRRLRAALTEFKSVFNKTRRNSCSDFIREITKELSEARELDVALSQIRDLMQMVDNKKPRAALTHLRMELRQKRQALSPAVRDMAEKIADPQFMEVCNLLVPVNISKKCIIDHAARRIEKRFKTLNEVYSKWLVNKTDSGLHQIRIAYKKLRYTCETYKNTTGIDLDSFLNRIKAIQEVLGQWHDCAVLLDYISNSNLPARDAFKPAREILLEKCHAQLKRFVRLAKNFFSERQRNEMEMALKPGSIGKRTKGSEK